jgi:hypothetical protein
MKLHLAKFIHSVQGKYLMSILLGFGFATFFRASCQGTDCLVRIAPPLAALKGDKMYSFGDKCYYFKKKSVSCPADSSNVVPVASDKI